MRNTTITLMVLNSLPMLVYPFVLMASLMGLAASGGGTSPALSFTLFLWTSLLYPLPWLIGLVGSGICLRRQRTQWALSLQLAVLAFLALVIALLTITMVIEGH